MFIKLFLYFGEKLLKSWKQALKIIKCKQTIVFEIMTDLLTEHYSWVNLWILLFRGVFFLLYFFSFQFASLYRFYTASVWIILYCDQLLPSAFLLSSCPFSLFVFPLFCILVVLLLFISDAHLLCALQNLAHLSVFSWCFKTFICS